jgi:hypothetical protein
VVEQVGSIAGFASVVGLAILSALYFSQARDLRRLREWAGRAPERAAEGQPGAVVPGRVVAVPQQRPAQPQGGPAPAPATPAAASPATAAAASGPNAEAAKDGEKPAEAAAAASNGDAAPKVSTPDGAAAKDAEKEGAPGAKPGMPAPASAAAAAGAGAKSVAGPAVAGAAGPGSTPGAPGPGGQPPTPGSPATAGAAAAAGSASAPPKPGGPQAPGARPGAQPQRPPGSVLPPRTGTLPPVRRLPSSNVGAPPSGVVAAEPPKKKRNPLYVALAIIGVLILGAGAAVGVPKLVNGSNDDSPDKAASSDGSGAAKKKKAAAKPVAPDKITVAVLNGTSIPGLAAQVGDRVDAEGFTLGTVSNASQSQGQRNTSVAMYAPGHERDATRVARQLDLRDVRKIDSETQQIAGDASVVVIVGSDKTQ